MAERVVVRRTKSTKPKVDISNLANVFRTWALEKEKEAVAKTVKERLRTDDLFPMIESAGTEDDKGSLILLFDSPIPITSVNADGVKKSTTYLGIKKEKRPSLRFLEDKAEAWLENHDLLSKVQVTTNVHTYRWDFAKNKVVQETEESTRLDQDALFVLNQEGLLPDRSLDSFFEENITWALVPIKA